MDASLPEPRRVAVGVGFAIAVLGALGALDLLAPSLPLSVFELDGERTVTAAFSAALLFGAGLLAWKLADAEGSGPSMRWSWVRFTSVFFVFMALDELLAIHERVSTPVTGWTWQVFYAPMALLAAVGWLKVLRRLPPGGARTLWLGGAAAWFVSQVIEAVQWDGGRLVHEWTLVPEEILEMSGSLMWGLALLLALRMGLEAFENHCGEPPPAEQDSEADRVARRRHGRRGGRVRGADREGQRSGAPTSRTPN